jgi:hypothetical protein
MILTKLQQQQHVKKKKRFHGAHRHGYPDSSASHFSTSTAPVRAASSQHPIWKANAISQPQDAQ